MKCLRYRLNAVAAEKFAGQHMVEHTLHAKMYAQAHASSTPAKSLAMTSTATSLLEALKRRRTDPQSSATARCTSELHSGNTVRTEFHVRRSMSVSVVGTSKCLKSELKVPRSAVSESAEIDRRRSRRRRASKLSYEGRIIERRSWVNFCMRLWESGSMRIEDHKVGMWLTLVKQLMPHHRHFQELVTKAELYHSSDGQEVALKRRCSRHLWQTEQRQARG
jgi:hypothetical protein